MKTIICQDKFHEDTYENGEVVELRKVDMVGNICDGCHEARQDAEAEYAANSFDMYDN